VPGVACSMANRQNGGVARNGTVPFRNASHYIRGVGVLVSIIYAVSCDGTPADVLDNFFANAQRR